ncbi:MULTISPECIES: ogr/Delta-like zinc finger family protein [unclassified Caballeronia]|uniref:ogr/Delta-like zinc finger family protein n=1 Tax=unclassified Caballeronia TaxID=2646786 RepID=UPI0020294486|nr:ogr/Delta-like zinc finger family protein [Caballeronia sp. LZ008]MDR5797461.1 ogr/Delta-like zinc finger family protein [Caballeronia sp. LZ008]
MRFTIACPHCGARGIARAMEKVTDTEYQIDFQCDDVTCGHTYRTRLEMFPPELPIPKRPRRDTQELEF